MTYLILRDVHITCVILSGIGFFLRGCWRLVDSPLYRRRWARILPHLVDTALLASAITLAVWSGQSPGSQPWLAAKLCALLAYIVLGTIALKRGRTPATRGAAFAGAVLVFAYIVAVAVTKQAWPL